VGLHIARAKWPSKNGKVYESIYLRHSYREAGKVEKRKIANLTHCPPEIIAAIELALKNKGDLRVLRSLREVEGGGSCLSIPTPRSQSGALLHALDISPPKPFHTPPPT